MKLTIERAALLRALTHVQSVVERRNTIPILANVQVEAEASGRLRLTATDLDLSVVEDVPATVGQPGRTTVPAHTLHDIVRKLPDGAEVELALDAAKGQVKLTAGRYASALSVLPAEDFPEIAEGNLPFAFSLPAEELKRLIDKTRFAISTEETRYYLNGIYLHVAEGPDGRRLRAVATDGHRLARVEADVPEGAAGMPGVIVPRKAVGELRKLVDEVDAEVSVALSETKIRFVFGDVVLVSKLIDGSFPDYERVIPAGNDKMVRIDCKPFAAAVDRVATISSEKSRAVRFSLTDGRLDLAVTSPDNGSASEELTVDYEGQHIDIGFNSRYVLDVAGQIDGDLMELAIADGASPVVIRDTADAGALYVLMPMRI
jgi:DNA polymerase-3 subunit beta